LHDIDQVRASTLTIDDAREVIAREYHFDGWPALVSFANAVADDERISRFERAADAVITGDLDALRGMLREHPELVRSRSARRHHATLLHYVGANGVEDHRQKTPDNAVAVARLLLDAGAEVDALADMYGERCTTMSMLVSSAPPHEGGLQLALAETLLDYGAALDGPGSRWQSCVETALAFGYLDTAQALARRGPPVTELATAAGLGLVDDVERLVPTADPASRHRALALAAQHGHVNALRVLLNAGEDPSRYNPDGLHSHSTPLHQAVWANHLDVVRLLVERGARLDVRDRVYSGTPLGWAEYGKRTEIADYLRGQTSGT
jgi:ankyrin repeat protein